MIPRKGQLSNSPEDVALKVGRPAVEDSQEGAGGCGGQQHGERRVSGVGEHVRSEVERQERSPRRLAGHRATRMAQQRHIPAVAGAVRLAANTRAPQIAS